MSDHALLVTGGAGYIGSHVAQALLDRGERVVVIDNLCTGVREAVPGGALLVEGDVGDEELVGDLLRRHRIDAVMHFAAHTSVAESMADPLRYYRNNAGATTRLLSACAGAGIRHFVFSSSAAVYGVPDGGIASEDSPTQPINPYGRSKLMGEQVLRDLGAVSPMRHVALRYFNVAGCDSTGRIGHSTPASTLLIKVAAEQAVGKRPHVALFGTDYDTRDGTCIRDYVHVEDLAEAHLCALDHLRRGGESLVLNCGYGHGYSVREILDAVQRIHGAPLAIVESPRRAGDPPWLVARAERIQTAIGWQPRRDDIDLIVRSTLAWEYRLAGRG
jgi:UDP-glucose 4-epimerase